MLNVLKMTQFVQYIKLTPQPGPLPEGLVQLELQHSATEREMMSFSICCPFTNVKKKKKSSLIQPFILKRI